MWFVLVSLLFHSALDFLLSLRLKQNYERWTVFRHFTVRQLKLSVNAQSAFSTTEHVLGILFYSILMFCSGKQICSRKTWIQLINTHEAFKLCKSDLDLLEIVNVCLSRRFPSISIPAKLWTNVALETLIERSFKVVRVLITKM